MKGILLTYQTERLGGGAEKYTMQYLTTDRSRQPRDNIRDITSKVADISHEVGREFFGLVMTQTGIDTLSGVGLSGKVNHGAFEFDGIRGKVRPFEADVYTLTIESNEPTGRSSVFAEMFEEACEKVGERR